MKKLLLLTGIVLWLSISVYAQPVATTASKIRRVTSDPAGQACQPDDVRIYNGAIYSCQSSVLTLSGAASITDATATVKGKAVLGAKDTTTIAGLGTCAAGNSGQSKRASNGNKSTYTCTNTTGATYAWIDESEGAVNVRLLGAKGDGVTIDDAAFLAAAALVNDPSSGYSRIIVPPHNAGGYYKLTVAIPITRSGVEIVGAGATSSAIINTTSGVNIIEVGDGTNQISEVKISHLSIQGGDSSDWAVYARKAPNTTITECSIANSSTAEGAIYLSESWNSRILNNTIGSVKGTALYVFNSSNGVHVTGNRIDGTGATGVGTGGLFSANNLVMTGTTIQGIGALGTLLGRGISFNNCYFESYDAGFTTGLNSISIAFRECYASPFDGVTPYFIDADAGVTGLKVDGLFILGDHATAVMRLGATAKKIELGALTKQTTLAPPASIYTGSVAVTEVVELFALPTKETVNTTGIGNAAGGHKLKLYGNTAKTEWLEMDFTSTSLYLASNKTGAGSYRNMYIGPFGGTVKLGFLYAGSLAMQVGASGLEPASAGAQNLGTAALPFQYIYFSGASGTPASNNFRLGGTATAARIVTFPDASITVARSDAAQTFTGLQTFNSLALANILHSATAPTVTSAGTSPSIPANNGTAAFTVNVGTGGTAHTIVLAMPTAATGWICQANNLTAAAANRADQSVRQTASTTTSVTLQNQSPTLGTALAFTASDIVQCTCVAY